MFRDLGILCLCTGNTRVLDGFRPSLTFYDPVSFRANSTSTGRIPGSLHWATGDWTKAPDEAPRRQDEASGRTVRDEIGELPLAANGIFKRGGLSSFSEKHPVVSSLIFRIWTCDHCMNIECLALGQCTGDCRWDVQTAALSTGKTCNEGARPISHWSIWV